MRLVPETQIALGSVVKAMIGKAACDVDKSQLAIGTAVELEHTKDAKAAEKIAHDHLEEDPRYYTRPMKKDWGAEEAQDRIGDLAKAASADGKEDCPTCGGKYVSQCRCSGPHSVEDLQKGHGRCCANGHRWSWKGGTTWSPEPVKTASSRHTQEAFWCLLAGMPMDEVSRKYQLAEGDMQELDNMAFAAAKRSMAELVASKIGRGNLPTAYHSLWDHYHGQRRASVFVFEDDQERVAIFRKAFGHDNVVVTSSVAAAVAMLRQGGFSRIYLDRDVSNPDENGEDLAWTMEQERLCSDIPVVIHSENTRGQKVMSRYIGRYHNDVTVMPFRQLRRQLDVPGDKR